MRMWCADKYAPRALGPRAPTEDRNPGGHGVVTDRQERTAPLCLPRSPSGRDALRRSVLSGYGRRRVDSPLDRLRDDEIAVPDAARARARESGAASVGRGAGSGPAVAGAYASGRGTESSGRFSRKGGRAGGRPSPS
jgi:hypothetical protein